MRKARRYSERDIRTPIRGMGVVLASTLGFLAFLGLLIVSTWLVLG
ncbi:MAG: hypothetical protein FWG23_08310 [Eggerthellaceae bacterium]|jgi:hypothetical protein|nr:hypothetical protein [Eggerthellaceae bacterium]MDR2716218.1 hypothetical protein [Coriobacteriaceae bacterium]